MRQTYITFEDFKNLMATIEALTRLVNSKDLTVIEKSYYEEVRNKLNIISLSEPWIYFSDKG